eukprot:CAMPEP_0197252496 /NCGR_PEP_ID=MMETSP1429-20130617/61667_1 /TAXON_ID=49237 /ORGANISM="Chaetoceros  sp., Strain UNC1202" /LENGTH=421 /DNA_ID=CAMNT_0042714899 /DNA_START=79 /DNA_END=1344 /DNA_ORIENTATION=-
MSKSPSLRRIQADIRELSIDPSDRYHAAPLENDMFEWHFTIRGADGTDFEGGYYHGRILLPAEYPFKPPNIVFLTPSGRFETNVKVCLSFSAYHPELWQPAWGIRLILEALVSFLPTKGDGAIGALDWTSEERKRLAKKSVDYVCPLCGKCSDIMKMIEKRVVARKKREGAQGGGSSSGATKSKFQKEIEQLHAFQMATEGGNTRKDDTKEESADGQDDENDKASGFKNDTKCCEGKVKDNQMSEKKASFNNEKKEIVVTGKMMEASTEIESGVEESSKSAIDEEDKSDDAERADAKMKEITNTQDVTAEREETDDIAEIQEDVHVQTQGRNDEAEAGTGEDENPETEALLDQNEIGQDNDFDGDDRKEQNLNSPLLSDPVLHTGILIFSIIIYMLLRKMGAVMDDMRDLEAQFRQLETAV